MIRLFSSLLRKYGNDYCITHLEINAIRVHICVIDKFVCFFLYNIAPITAEIDVISAIKQNTSKHCLQNRMRCCTRDEKARGHDDYVYYQFFNCSVYSGVRAGFE